MTGLVPERSFQDTAAADASFGTRISWVMRVPSGSANVQLGQGSIVKAAIRVAPSGYVTSGPYACEVIAYRPAGVVTHASKPLTRTTRPVGGVVAVRSSA